LRKSAAQDEIRSGRGVFIIHLIEAPEPVLELLARFRDRSSRLD